MLLLRHRSTHRHREVLLTITCWLRVETLLRSYLSQHRINSGLLQVGGRRFGARVVADEVEVLASGSRDAEWLLHQVVRLISVTIGSLICPVTKLLIIFRCGLRCLAGSGYGALRNIATSVLALHLSVRQKAAGDSTCTPWFAVSPSAHACFPLIPDEYRARPNGLLFLLWPSSLHSW